MKWGKNPNPSPYFLKKKVFEFHRKSLQVLILIKVVSNNINVDKGGFYQSPAAEDHAMMKQPAIHPTELTHLKRLSSILLNLEISRVPNATRFSSHLFLFLEGAISKYIDKGIIISVKIKSFSFPTVWFVSSTC